MKQESEIVEFEDTQVLSNRKRSYEWPVKDCNLGLFSLKTCQVKQHFEIVKLTPNGSSVKTDIVFSAQTQPKFIFIHGTRIVCDGKVYDLHSTKLL